LNWFGIQAALRKYGVFFEKLKYHVRFFTLIKEYNNPRPRYIFHPSVSPLGKTTHCSDLGGFCFAWLFKELWDPKREYHFTFIAFLWKVFAPIVAVRNELQKPSVEELH